MLSSIQRSVFKRLAAAALSLSCMTFGGVAAAETVEVFYKAPSMGSEHMYGSVIHVDNDGNSFDLTGSQITSSTVIVTFRPGRDVDVSQLFLAMTVPVIGSESSHFVVSGSMLVKTGRNRYTYSLTTDMFNGEIRPGRFSLESYGLDAQGMPFDLPGRLSANTGFYYTVDVATAPVPEPASTAMLLGGLMLLPLVLRRQRRGVAT